MSGTKRMENPNAPKTRPIPDCASNGAACAGLKAECEARTEEIAENERLRSEIERLREENKTLKSQDWDALAATRRSIGQQPRGDK